jgi:multisubunit Na+/H+ antiporter MnhB subunit
MIPAGLVSFVTLLWGIGWIVFARIHKTPALRWFCVPIFAVTLIYLYYSFVPVRIEIRAEIARMAILAIALSQSIILFVFSHIEREQHER